MPSYAVDTFVNPLEVLNPAQLATLGALGALVRDCGTDGVSVCKTTCADGLEPMPEAVYTVYPRLEDGTIATPVFLHPDGTLRLNYAPAAYPLNPAHPLD